MRSRKPHDVVSHARTHRSLVVLGVVGGPHAYLGSNDLWLEDAVSMWA